MTNEEKAKEIGTSFGKKWNNSTLAGGAQMGALEMAEWKDKNPSDETIMRIFNCIGYEEDSWIEFVRKRLENI